MKLEILSPRKVLSKAYLRQTVVQKDIETFVFELKRMFERFNARESEENHKSLMSDFLKSVYYAHQYEINTKQRHDLVIHLGKSHQDAVGVIIETKKYTNKSEMISPEKPNVKALHELIRYYLIERLQDENHQVKHLIITDLYKCYIFDEVWFHQNIYENATVKKEYKDWKNSGHNTDFFYKNIAAKGIEKMEKDIPCVCIDMFALYESIKDCTEINDTLPNLPQIIDTYKLFSPQHLLKLAFSNDSNSLNKAFYNEFLHIIGLTEVKDGGKKLIQRKAVADREAGSLLENALNQILLQQGNYAQTNENESFSLALELCITWLNRILFLKLLEAQLIRYHNGDRKYAFMNIEYIDQFDILNELFFEVMAIPEDQRRPEVAARYGHIPYLNSSLFDRSESEIQTHVSIANLKDRLEISLFGQTVLKDEKGTPLKGKMNSLRYLLLFLDAYNFGSTEEGQMQQDNKTLINAAVLGLIFEKINGYQDGSFFTPSYITMYMCRETLRRAVVQKVAEKENIAIDNFEDLMAYCRRFFKKDDLLRLNTHINSLKICDPAVGSGHFLVSALNELICIKSDLGILIDENGLPLRYQITIENDELFVIDAQTNDLFEYHFDKQNKLVPQLQTVQKTLFEEKRNLIENCLFGVDINPKSVMICRLRLWIELLKSAYYYAGTVVSSQPPQRGGANSQTPQKNNQTPTLPPLGGAGGGQPSSLFPFGGGGQPSSLSPFDGGEQPSSFPPFDGGGQPPLLYLQTLPNIDINIKTGNSLISKLHINDNYNRFTSKQQETIRRILPKYKTQVDDYKRVYHKGAKAQIIKDIAKYKAEFQRLYNPNDADYLNWQKKENEILALNREMSFDENYTERLEQLQTEAAELEQKYKSKMAVFKNAFEWRYEFPEVCDEEGKFVGFDVVIGNPPYIQLQDNGGVLANLFENMKYATFERAGDIYALFYEKGFQILKTNGFLSFITSSQWIKAGYGKSLREYFLSQNPLLLMLLGPNIFDTATVDTNILIAQKASYQKQLNGTIITEGSEIINNTYLPISMPYVNTESWLILDNEKQAFREKLISKSKPLKEWDIKIYRGVLTGYNEAFLIDEAKRNELINEDANAAQIIRPILRGREIHKYYTKWEGGYLIATHNGVKSKNIEKINIDVYPNIKDYLDSFGLRLINRSDRGDTHYNLRNCAYLFEFSKEKVIWKRIGSILRFSYSNEEMYCLDSTCIATGEKIKYLTAFLNSKLAHYQLFEKAPRTGMGDLIISVQALEPLLVYYPSEKEEQPFINLVDKILDKKEKGEDTLALEKEIDQLVYALYALTPEEIALVEGQG